MEDVGDQNNQSCHQHILSPTSTTNFDVFTRIFDTKNVFRTSWSHLEHQKQLVLHRLFQKLIPIGQHRK